MDQIIDCVIGDKHVKLVDLTNFTCRLEIVGKTKLTRNVFLKHYAPNRFKAASVAEWLRALKLGERGGGGRGTKIV